MPPAIIKIIDSLRGAPPSREKPLVEPCNCYDSTNGVGPETRLLPSGRSCQGRPPKKGAALTDVGHRRRRQRYAVFYCVNIRRKENILDNLGRVAKAFSNTPVFMRQDPYGNFRRSNRRPGPARCRTARSPIFLPEWAAWRTGWFPDPAGRPRWCSPGRPEWWGRGLRRSITGFGCCRRKRGN